MKALVLSVFQRRGAMATMTVMLAAAALTVPQHARADSGEAALAVLLGAAIVVAAQNDDHRDHRYDARYDYRRGYEQGYRQHKPYGHPQSAYQRGYRDGRFGSHYDHKWYPSKGKHGYKGKHHHKGKPGRDAQRWNSRVPVYGR